MARLFPRFLFLPSRFFLHPPRFPLPPPPPPPSISIAAAAAADLSAATPCPLAKRFGSLPRIVQKGEPRGVSVGSRARRSARLAEPAARGRRRRRRRRNEGKVELNVVIGIEEALPDDPQIMSIADALQTDACQAMKVAFDHLSEASFNTRDASISDVNNHDTIELSLLLCDDEFIQKLNKEWRAEDHATDVLSMSQHVPEISLPNLLLGDIVISVETAGRQAAERGHSLLDEIRILMVHGLLHLLGFDHELSVEAEDEMEREELYILETLHWKGKGLIKSANDVAISKPVQVEPFVASDDMKRPRTLAYEPKLSHIIFDIDSALVDDGSYMNPKSTEAFMKAISTGVTVILVTGKSRPTTVNTLEIANMGGNKIVTSSSPGVFLQGSLVYGRQGQEVYKANLDRDVCIEAALYSLEHRTPLVMYCQDQCFTLFEHPSIGVIHVTYHEPTAIVIPSIEHLLERFYVQKLAFLDTAEQVSSVLQPYWSQAIKLRANVIHTHPHMLEIVPLGTSKGKGLRMLLDHLGIMDEKLELQGDYLLLQP